MEPFPLPLPKTSALKKSVMRRAVSDWDKLQTTTPFRFSVWSVLRLNYEQQLCRKKSVSAACDILKVDYICTLLF